MKKRSLNIIRTILIIIIIFISATIFGFSSQNAEESSSISGKVAQKIIEIQPKYKNINEGKKKELISNYQKPIRKLAHFSIYTLLGMAIAGLVCTYKINNKKRVAIAVSAGMLYAISDEIHQIFVSGRSGQITDVLIDTIGIIVGTIIVLKIIKLVKIKNVEK